MKSTVGYGIGVLEGRHREVQRIHRSPNYRLISIQLKDADPELARLHSHDLCRIYTVQDRYVAELQMGG